MVANLDGIGIVIDSYDNSVSVHVSNPHENLVTDSHFDFSSIPYIDIIQQIL
jgi:hypothetical protein